MISPLAHEAIVRISHGIPSATRLPFLAFMLFSLSLSFSVSLLFWRPLIPFLLPAATTLPSAVRYPARAVPVLVNLWMNTEAKSYRYLPRGLHEWPAIRKFCGCARVRCGRVFADVCARARVAFSASERARCACGRARIKEAKCTGRLPYSR